LDEGWPSLEEVSGTAYLIAVPLV